MSILSPEIASAVTQGIARNTSPERKAARAQAKLQKEISEHQLANLDVQAKERSEALEFQQQVNREEFENLKLQNNKLKAEMTKQKTFQALDAYNTDKDSRHFNNLARDLKASGLAQGPFTDIVNVDNITEDDAELLRSQGFNPEEVFNTPSIISNLVKTVGLDGEQTIRSVDHLKAATGYLRYASQRELQDQKFRTDLELNRQRAKQAAASATKSLAQADKASSAAPPKDSALDIKTQQEREALRSLKNEGLKLTTKEGLRRYGELFQDIIQRDRQTATSKDFDEVDVAIENIDKTAKKEFGKDFFDLDMTNPSLRRRFERDVERVERLGHLDLSERQITKLGQLKQLIATSGPASRITSRETGIADRFLGGVKKFLFDKVEGVEATSAYAAYRNILIKALYGATVTEAEAGLFREQFGSLGQQTAPVLVQFRTALSQLKAEIETISNVNNSYVTHFRLGKDREELDSIVFALDERIEEFARLEQGLSLPKKGATPVDNTLLFDDINVPSEDTLTDEDLQSLDAILEAMEQQ